VLISSVPCVYVCVHNSLCVCECVWDREGHFWILYMTSYYVIIVTCLLGNWICELLTHFYLVSLCSCFIVISIISSRCSCMWF
jgi:hypothetical protein